MRNSHIAVFHHLFHSFISAAYITLQSHVAPEWGTKPNAPIIFIKPNASLWQGGARAINCLFMANGVERIFNERLASVLPFPLPWPAMPGVAKRFSLSHNYSFKHDFIVITVYDVVRAIIVRSFIIVFAVQYKHRHIHTRMVCGNKCSLLLAA